MRAIKSENRVAMLFFVALILKYLLYGFTYYPVLDDFIQYGGYPLYGDLGYVWFGIGTMVSRPLASLLDPLLWGSFWNVMGVSLCIITLLHFSAVSFLERTLRRAGCAVSPLFWVLALLMPIGMEGAYWISASSRLVVGLFFASASLYCLSHALEEGNKPYSVGFLLLHILAYGFYEAVAVFAFLGAAALFWRYWDKTKRKKWLMLIPILCLLSMFCYTMLASGIGAMGSRASGFSFDGIFAKLWEALYQLGRIFTKGIIKSTAGGFFSGVKVLLGAGLWGAFLLILTAIVSVLIARFSNREKEKKPLSWGWLLLGALLFFAPLAPNVLVETVWLPYRSIFVSLIGFALMAETLISRIPVKKVLKNAVFSLLVFICVIAGINEYDTYRRVSEQDVRLVQNIAERLDSRVQSGERNAIVILEQPIETMQVDFYKDHVKSVMEQDWSLTGALRAVTKNMKIKLVTPVLAGEEQIEKEQVLYLGADGHITQIRESIE